MAGKPKLRESVLAKMRADFAERRRLQSIMAEHAYDILEIELGFSRTTIVRIEKRGYSPEKFPLVPPVIGQEIERRRNLYWSVREIYLSEYTYLAMMAKYGVSKPTILRRLREYTDMQREQLRMAA